MMGEFASFHAIRVDPARIFLEYLKLVQSIRSRRDGCTEWRDVKMARPKSNRTSPKRIDGLPKRDLSGSAAPTESCPRPSRSGRKVFLICLLLFGIVLSAFLPVTGNEFICYDDTEYVTENPHVQAGLNMANLQWALTSGYVNWHPL